MARKRDDDETEVIEAIREEATESPTAPIEVELLLTAEDYAAPEPEELVRVRYPDGGTYPCIEIAGIGTLMRGGDPSGPVPLSLAEAAKKSQGAEILSLED